MASFAISALIDRARAAADMHDTFVTDAQALSWFKVELANLDRFCLREGYVPRETSTTVTTASLSLTGSLIAILGVYEVVGSTYRFIPPGDTLLGPAGRHDVASETGSPVSYRVKESASSTYDIAFYPRPTSAMSFLVYHVSEQTVTTTASTVHYMGGVEELAVLKVARRMLAKEESNTLEIQRQIKECEVEVSRFCWDKLTSGPQVVRNLDKHYRGWTDYPQIPTRERWLVF